jgi:hypothetical protein
LGFSINQGKMQAPAAQAMSADAQLDRLPGLVSTANHVMPLACGINAYQCANGSLLKAWLPVYM